MKLISSPAVCGLTAVHSCLPSATHRTKMTLSCRRAVVLSSRACDSRLLAVFIQSASFCLHACWRMKDELFTAGRGGCCRPWRCCSHCKCFRASDNSFLRETRCICLHTSGRAYGERGTRPRAQLRDGLPVCWPRLINRVKPATLKWDSSGKEGGRFNSPLCTLPHL